MIDALNACITESPATEIALQVYPEDVLHIHWGAVLAQRRGTKLTPFSLQDGCHGLILARRGKLVIEADDQPFTVREGQTLIIKPGETIVGAAPHKSDVYCPWLAFKVDHSRTRSQQGPIRVPRVADAPEASKLGELLILITEDYQDYQQTEGDYQPLARRSCQYLLRSVLSRLDPTELELRDLPPYYVVLSQRAKEYVRMNLHQDLSSEAIACALECSAGYLRWAYRKANREGIRDYVTRMRMAKARYYLVVNPRCSVTDIARSCGQTNLNYFTYTFTRYHGMPPTEYRAAHANVRVDVGI